MPLAPRRTAVVLAVALAAATLARAAAPAPAGGKPAAKGAAATRGSPKTTPPSITDEAEDPRIWGAEFPLQYQTWKKTVDETRTKFGGSEALPRPAEGADPRSAVARSRVDQDPRLRTMWAGYAFADDVREERGHAYMLDSETVARRPSFAAQPGACLQCHASVVLPYRKLGAGDAAAGARKMDAMSYADARPLVTHPVACLDCHDPRTMALRVTRPAFVEGMRALKAAQGVKDYDVNRQATRKELRAFVCGQCHVEYYLAGPERQLVYPWSKGLRVEQLQEVYDEAGHKDWTHEQTGAPVLKAQHPEFEMWSQGIHARSGVACPDCHMPTLRTPGGNITDHHINSPALKIEASCRGCHKKYSVEELHARIEAEQDRFLKQRSIAMDALMGLIADLERARAAGKGDADLEVARYLHRRAQFYLDFVESENSVGFHAPQESLRVVQDAINYARQGQLALRDPSFKPDLKIPRLPAGPGPSQRVGPAPR